jgi:ATP-binding cassette subfamily B protein/subfamily B ATP-binding cassette protein MsbA
LAYLAPYRGLVGLTFFFAALTTSLELLPPWLIKVVIDDVIPTKNMDLLFWVLVGLVMAYGLKNLCNALRIRFNNTLEQRVVHRLRQQVFEALQRLSLNYYENRATGEIMSRVVNDTEHVQRIFIDGFEGMLTATLTLVGITTILFMLNWKLAFLVLLPIPILIIGGVVFTRRVHGYYHEIRQHGADLNGYLQDALSGIRETMGFNRQSYEESRFRHLSEGYSQANLKAMYLWSLYSPAMIFIGLVSFIPPLIKFTPSIIYCNMLWLQVNECLRCWMPHKLSRIKEQCDHGNYGCWAKWNGGMSSFLIVPRSRSYSTSRYWWNLESMWL